ncbi:MAG TPA: YXWGXW repeat-containing protein, partial [Methylovirgula sp.]
MRKISSTLFLSSSVVAFLAMASASAPVVAQEMQCAAPVAVTSEPPPMPDYDQPPEPGPDYMWTPGYWSYSDDEDDYYWVPGTWVLPPQPGLLWTPGYWAWVGGSYLFHPGYWGDEVGYYGGVDYGYGYGPDGYDGGRWEGGHFMRNRDLGGPHSHISFNGGAK